MMIAE